MTPSDTHTAGARRAKWIAVVVTVLLIGAGVGWAGAVVFAPPKNVLADSPYTLVTVAAGSVGSSINLNTVAQWTVQPAGSNLAVGTVTTVNVTAGQDVGAGSVLYTVNLRPVVVAQGTIPAFRALTRGVTGQDVAELQQLLATLGYYKGAQNGSFGYSTTQAVQSWQRHLGESPDGVVQSGDLVFVPTLPTRVSLDAKVIARGVEVTGGEPVVKALPDAPVFTIPATGQQAALMPSGTRVVITGPSGQSWTAFVSGQSPEQSQAVTVYLSGAHNSTICRDQCGKIPITGQTLLASRIVTVETRHGLTVPTAALISLPGGGTAVVDKGGTRRPVTVITSARGMSVITGVKAGLRVRIPAITGN